MNECRSRSAPTPSPSTMSTAAPARRRRPCSTSAWRRWWRASSRATTPPCSPTARSVNHSFLHPQPHVPFIQSKDPYDMIPGPPRWGVAKSQQHIMWRCRSCKPFSPSPAHLLLPLCIMGLSCLPPQAKPQANVDCSFGNLFTVELK